MFAGRDLQRRLCRTSRSGSGEPLVYLCGSTPNHRNPRPGLERTLTLRTINPLARAGFEVYFTNRWPGMAARYQLLPMLPSDMPKRFSTTSVSPWTCLGASTGGSPWPSSSIADRPDAVRKAVVACAAYTLGPLAKKASN